MAKFDTVAEYVESLPADQREICEKVIPLIEEVLAGTGAVWHGHPVWSLGGAPGKSPVCMLKAYGSHLTFGFWKGREITDPSGRMDTGGGMAGVKLRGVGDIDPDLFGDWLHQAKALDS